MKGRKNKRQQQEERRNHRGGTFVCLDTNILIRVLTQGGLGHEPKAWQEFKELVERRKVTLLVTEIVLLEFDKFVNNAPDNLLAETKKLGGLIQNQVWNEVRANLQDHLKAPLELWRSKLEAEWRKRGKSLRDWLYKGEQIPFTEAISHLTERRFVAGQIPKKNQKEQSADKTQCREKASNERLIKNDCLIIDSLVSKFANSTKDKQLLFCTLNLKDFGRDVKGKKTLLNCFKKGLPPTQIFDDLESLVTFVNQKGTVEEPTPQEVKQVIEFEQKVAAELEAKSKPQVVVPEASPVIGLTMPQAMWQKDKKVTVALLEDVGLILRQVGTIEFDRIPITKPDDYRSTYSGLPFNIAKEISTYLANGSVIGVAGPNGEFTWREGTEF